MHNDSIASNIIGVRSTRKRFNTSMTQGIRDGDIDTHFPEGIGDALREVLRDIEQFVDGALTTRGPAFSNRTVCGNSFQYRWSRLAVQYFPCLDRMLSHFSPDLIYGAKVNLFFSVGRELNAFAYRFISPNEVCKDGRVAAELFNRLVERIREEGKRPEFRKLLHRRSYAASRSFMGLKRYVDVLFEHVRSRLIVIRIDLKYRIANATRMRTDEAQRNLQHLFSNMRGNDSLFADLVGYIWKLECGELGADHFHVILFYTNDHFQNDSHRAELVGLYWVEVVTKGRGAYFNCNRPDYKAKQRRPALGRIEYDDLQKRSNLDLVLKYLCKSEQQVQAKTLRKSRTIGRGEMPQVKEVRAGRPRKRGHEDASTTAV